VANLANKCPQCKKYIIGYYCFQCKIDISDFMNDNSEILDDADIPDFMKDIFGNFGKNKSGKKL